MDRPFDGATIDGPRQQEIKRGSTITLTCKAIILQINENENNHLKLRSQDATHRTKRVIWSVNNTPLTLQVQFLHTMANTILLTFCLFFLDKKRRH